MNILRGRWWMIFCITTVISAFSFGPVKAQAPVPVEGTGYSGTGDLASKKAHIKARLNAAKTAVDERTRKENGDQKTAESEKKEIDKTIQKVENAKTDDELNAISLNIVVLNIHLNHG